MGRGQARGDTGLTPEPLIAVSKAMREIETSLPRIAASTAPVVIEGETGSGKGRIAEALHELSPRRDGPYEILSCGAIAESLADSEFFGHGRGAFTHAFEAQSGRLERANGGTLVLDHIEDLPPAIQAKLLRAIEDGKIQRLGESAERRVDVRYVATSRGALKDAIALGTFRDDLYHRLSVVTIPVPPLRERVEDIMPLATAFLAAERRRPASRRPRFRFSRPTHGRETFASSAPPSRGPRCATRAMARWRPQPFPSTS
jgi:DNA-binding NtrC family response regulator